MRAKAGNERKAGRFGGERGRRSRAVVAAGFLAAFGLTLLSVWAAPSAPPNFAAQSLDGAVSLTWDAEPSATVYHLYRVPFPETPTPLPTATPAPVATVPADAPLSFLDAMVTNGRRYLYFLSGEDAGGQGPAATSTALPFSVPKAVAPVTVQALRSGSLDLTWGEPLSSFPVSFYQVHRVSFTLSPTPTPGGPPVPTATSIPGLQATLVAQVTPLATALSAGFTDQTVDVPDPSVAYYLVRAVDDRGNVGALPTTVTLPGTTQANLPPVPPLLQSQPLATVTPTYGIRLSWNGAAASESVLRYEILADAVTLATVVVTPTPVQTYVYEDQSLPFSDTAGLYRQYVVRAVNIHGTTGSNSVSHYLSKSFLLGAAVVTPDATSGAVTMTWNQGFAGSYGFAGYRLYKGFVTTPVPAASGTSPTHTPTITPTPFAVVVATASATPTLIHVDPQPNAHRYQYWVEPYDALGMGGVRAYPTPVFLDLAPTPVGSPGVSGPVPGTNNEITVSWGAANGGFYGPPAGYVLYRGYAATQSPTPIATLSHPVTAFLDHAPASPGASVVYQVAAYDAFGNLSGLSTISGPATLLGVLSAPSVPMGLPVSGDEATLRLSWLLNPPADQVTSYLVFGPDWPGVGSTPTPVATLLPTPSGMAYDVATSAWNGRSYYVAAENVSGVGSPTTLSGIPVPTYQVSAAVTPGVREVKVSWTMVPTPGSTPAVSHYGIYRSSISGSGFTFLGTVPVGTTEFTDTGASAGVSNHYRVTARAQSGSVTVESPLYPTQAPTPEAGILAWPNAPTGVTASAGSGAVTLYWASNPASENVLSYTVERLGTPTAVVTATPVGTHAYVLPESAGQAVSYRISAENASGTGEMSEEIRVLTAPAVTPVALMAQPQVTITVPGYPGDVDGYVLYRSTSPGVLGSQVASLSQPDMAVSVAVTPGYVNHFRVVGNAGGLSADPEASADLPVTAWPAPPVLELSASDSSVLAAWTPVGNVPVTGYVLHRNAYPTQTPSSTVEVTPPTQSHPDGGLVSGSAYTYWIEALNGSGTSGLSPPRSVIAVDAPTLQVAPGSGRNILSWSPVTVGDGFVTGYAVYRAVPSPGATPTFVPHSAVLRGLDNTEFVDSGLSSGVTYHYRVAAAPLAGVPLGGFSNAVPSAVQPMPVTALRAISGDGVVQLRWEYQGTPENLYILERRLGSAPDSSFAVLDPDVVGTDYVDNDVTNKTFYVYRLLTVAQGVTLVSEPVEALPAKPPVVAARTVSLTQNQSGNVLAFWPANTSPANPTLYDLLDPASMYPLGGYLVHRSPDGGGVYEGDPDFIPATGTSADAAVSLAHLDALQLIGSPVYTYLVQAVDAPPDLPYPLSQAATMGLVHATGYDTVTAFPVSAGTALDRNAIRPNGAPNEQVVNIRFVAGESGRVIIKVHTLSGVLVKKLLDRDFTKGVYGLPGSSYPLSWDARNMNGTLVASGVYLISAELPGGVREFRKVAVIK